MHGETVKCTCICIFGES